MAEPASPARLLTGIAGVATITLGLVIGLREVPADAWWPVGRWLVAGVVAHDAVLAPISVVLGLVVLRRVPEGWRPAARAALLVLGASLLLLACVLVASGLRRNPTVLPFPTWASVLGAAALVLVVPAAVRLWSARLTRSRASAPPAAPDPPPATPPPR